MNSQVLSIKDGVAKIPKMDKEIQWSGKNDPNSMCKSYNDAR